MAIGIINWNIQQDGNDDNGGGYVQGGTTTNYSLQSSPQVIFDGSVIKLMSSGVTNVMQCTGYTGLPTDSGNMIHVIGGTNATPSGWYEIKNVDSSGWYIVDRDWCTDAVPDGSGRMGGALATVGGMGSILSTSANVRSTGSRIWLKYKATPYVLTGTTTNIRGGPFKQDTNWNYSITIEGYESVQGDDCPNNRPQINNGGYNANGVIQSDENAGTFYVANIIANKSSGSLAYGFYGYSDARHIFVKCKSIGTTTGFVSAYLINCEMISCGTGCSSVVGIKCVASGGTIGFDTGRFFHCLAHGNSGRGFVGWIFCYRCVAADNIGDGFDDDSDYAYMIECVSTNNAYGYDINTTTAGIILNSYAYGNSTPIDGIERNCNPNGTTKYVNSTSIITSPWIDSSADQYWLNDTIGGGKILRGAGMKLPLTGVIDSSDIATTQHADPINKFLVLRK